jgi:uncharacterized membrane protein
LPQSAPSKAADRERWLWRGAGIALALAYPFAVHYGVMRGNSTPGVALLAAVAGYALAAALAAPPVARWLLPAAGAAVAVAAPDGSARVLDLPPILVPLALAWVFGRTLAGNSTPLVSRFAEFEQGGALTPELARYTRRLTWVWTLFLIALAAVSAWLSAGGDREAWSWFTNFASYLLIGALFAGEYAWRRIRFRNYRHDSPLKLASRIRLADLLRRH